MEIIKVGFINSEGETKGCESAPNEILGLLKEIHSNEKNIPIEYEKLKIDEIHVDNEEIEESLKSIHDNCIEIFEKNFKCFFIGGDHSISFPIIKAFRRVEENPLLVIFDSHGDCDSLSNSFNRKWLKELIDNGFSGDRIVLISARNLTIEEILFLKERKVTLIKMDLLQEDLEGICDVIMERARKSSGFYISIDIDSIDPAFAPGTYYLEPGGLSSRDIIYFIKRLSLLKNFRGGDIVEINPHKDVNWITVKLAAKLLAEMI